MTTFNESSLILWIIVEMIDSRQNARALEIILISVFTEDKGR